MQTPQRGSIKICLIEDDPAITDALHLLLTSQEMSVTCYNNGTAVLQNNFIIPDLFLIDKQLSGVDGLEICKQLKSRVDTKHIPVIIISASPHVQRLAIMAGADAFIEKPFANKLLLNTILTFFEKK